MENWTSFIRFEQMDTFIYNLITSKKNCDFANLSEISEEIIQALKFVLVSGHKISLLLPTFIEIEDLAQIFDSLFSDQILKYLIHLITKQF